MFLMEKFVMDFEGLKFNLFLILNKIKTSPNSLIEVENIFESSFTDVFCKSFTPNILEKSIDLLCLCNRGNKSEGFRVAKEMSKSPRELFFRISKKSKVPAEETD